MITSSQRTFRIVSAALFLLALAWQQIEATRLGYAVERLRKEAHRRRGRIDSLRMEIETSLSPAQLAMQAKDKLGMFPAAPESLRILGSVPAPGPKQNFLSRLFSGSWLGLALPLRT